MTGLTLNSLQIFDGRTLEDKKCPHRCHAQTIFKAALHFKQKHGLAVSRRLTIKRSRIRFVQKSNKNICLMYVAGQPHKMLEA